MEGPAVKRPKLQLGEVRREDWCRWSNNLEKLQDNLAIGCLCHVETLELQRPILPASGAESIGRTVMDTRFLKDYTLQFISTINLLCETALKQKVKGFICKKVMDMSSGVAMDEGIWNMLIEYLDSSDKFITFATSKCLVTLFMWTKLSTLNEIFDELFDSVMITSNNPLKLSHILDIIRGVVEYRDEDDHPLELDDQHGESEDDRMQTEDSSTSEDAHMLEEFQRTSLNTSSDSSDNSRRRRIARRCFKIEVVTEIENEVKTLCVKALENWWGRLLEKFQNMMAVYEDVNEAPILTFLSLWLSIISVKNNLSVIDTKHYYMHLKNFVPLLNSNSPAVLWKKLIDVFNEILCYGSTLSLQDVPNEEPCDLAHLLIRWVKSQKSLAGAPFSRGFSGFGGTSYGPVDWEWESRNQDISDAATGRVDLTPGRKLSPKNQSSSSFYPQPAIPSSSKSCSLLPQPISSSSSSRLKRSVNLPQSSSSVSDGSHSNNVVPGPGPSSAIRNKEFIAPNFVVPRISNPKSLEITTTVYIGPSREVAKLEETFDEGSGDRTLLQKIVLLVLKSVAVTVKETRSDDSDSGSDNSSTDGSTHSGSESDTNDMLIIEKLIREVFRELDAFIKSVQPFHPETPLGVWMVKLFEDQDDALIEAMLCALDTYTGFQGRIDTAHDFNTALNPIKTFVAFLNVVSNDKDILLDWLMGNETCFLLYLLRFLKFALRNWSEFVSSCGRDLNNTMTLLIRLRMSVGRLVERSLFPYNINPVLRLLEKCENMYETNDGNNS